YALTAPLTASAGDSIVVNDTTKNQGGTPTPSTSTAFYLSTNTTLDASDVALGSRVVNPLNYNVTHVAQTTLTIPASTSLGTYYVLAQADSGNVVTELVETNNLKASAAMKVGSDLSVTVLTSTSYVGAGDVVNVNDTTANLGATDAPESTTRFYFSVNTTLDASDP